MQLNIAKSAGEQWPRWLEEFDGNIYHSLEWAETQRSDHSQPLFFYWLDDRERCIGIAVGIKSWSPTRYVGRFSRQLAFETYPAVKGGSADLTRQMLEQLLSFAKKKGYRRLAVHSFQSRILIPDLKRIGFDPQPRIEFALDLRRSDDELLMQLTSHHRRKVKKAARHNMQFQEACTMDAMRQLRNLQLISRDRRRERGEDIGLMQDAYYETLGRQYFSKNLGRVFLMQCQGQAVSAAFVSIYAQRALYMYGGSSAEGFKTDAPALLFCNIFSRCRELGCNELNLGGVPAAAVNPASQSHGLFRFKAGFGGQQRQCNSAFAENLNPFTDKLVQLAKKLLRSG